MAFLETPEEKKSFAITSIIFALLLVIVLTLGLTYMDPPPENGIAINFGTSDVGQGDVQPTEPVASPASAKSEPETSAEDVATQDIEEATVITPKKDVKTPKKPTETKPKTEVKKPSKTTTNALDSFLKGDAKDGKDGGHGNDGLPGDKGDPSGSIYDNSFYGQGVSGTGGSKGWGLAGRKNAQRVDEKPDCEETGRVVVKIWVNRNGSVTKAERSQGTTNSADCLVSRALSNARAFKWQPDNDAPETQIGFIVFNFNLK